MKFVVSAILAATTMTKAKLVGRRGQAMPSVVVIVLAIVFFVVALLIVAKILGYLE